MRERTAGGVDGLEEFDVLAGVGRGLVERFVVGQQVGELGEGWLSAAGGDVGVVCTTGTSKVLMVLTVETALLTRSAWSIERTPASWGGW